MRRSVLGGKLVAGIYLAGVCAPLMGQSAPPASAQPAAAEPNAAEWKRLAEQDVRAAYDIYVANHPGMHDPVNKGFPAQLKRARDAASARASAATDQAGYVEALGAFSAELSDGHAQLGLKSGTATATVSRQWPGFVAAWRGDAAIVHHASAGFPVPTGSAISGCDGMPVADFMKDRLLSRGFRPKEAGHWWARAPQAFYSASSWAKKGPQTCTFKTPAGVRQSLKLNYTPVPENFMDLVTAATDGERTPIGMTEPRPGIFLIGLPDFQPNEEGVKSYEALFETLKARRPDLLKARAVVLDLRHNNGGSSAWSHRIAGAIWGEAAFDPRIENYFRDVRIWWRASKDNTSYMSEMEAKVRKTGNNEVADSVRKNGEGMKAALARGEHFYVQGDDKSADMLPTPPSDFKAPVYVITPGRCGSACNDAVDAFKQFDNVKLIGAPTSADSTYMEVRSADLPSGIGRIVIPNKVWMNRPRGSGEVYMPDIEVRDPDWSTATFLSHVERDLAR